MKPANSMQQKKTTGEVRVRSNICASEHDWQLVPGDVLKAYGVMLNETTPMQREEVMRYEPCCLCHRTICEIREYGCDHYTCRRQGLPSTADAERKREERLRREDASYSPSTL